MDSVLGKGDSMTGELVYWHKHDGYSNIRVLVNKDPIKGWEVKCKKLYPNTYIIKVHDEATNIYRYYLDEHTDYDLRIYRLFITHDLDWILF